LTDYGKAPKYDQILIDTLKRNYHKVFFWIQGAFDKTYFDQLQNTDGIEIVSPSLESYHQLLSTEQLDYVGTRLHGGIYALQHQKRTIILSIDNRVQDIQESYSLPVLERSKISELGTFLNQRLEINVRINQQNIKKWLSQFERAKRL
jgi:polysaccharide pyruvyl transferase WcaK-like protein